MILYHGSPVVVSKPDLAHSRARVDFGPGFYTTPLQEQATNWCRRFKRHGEAYVNCYSIDEGAMAALDVLSFDSYSEEWLDFVAACRRGLDTTTHDIVFGGVANDKVFDTIELYFDGLIAKEEALGRLRFEQPNAQVCFRTQTAVNLLHFEGSEEA